MKVQHNSVAENEIVLMRIKNRTNLQCSDSEYGKLMPYLSDAICSRDKHSSCTIATGYDHYRSQSDDDDDTSFDGYHKPSNMIFKSLVMFLAAILIFTAQPFSCVTATKTKFAFEYPLSEDWLTHAQEVGPRDLFNPVVSTVNLLAKMFPYPPSSLFYFYFFFFTEDMFHRLLLVDVMSLHLDFSFYFVFFFFFFLSCGAKVILSFL